MKIKRYSAKTEYEAMQQIRKELGDGAYILHTKKVKPKGVFSFFKKTTVEVMVGIEEASDKSEKDEEIRLLRKDNEETKLALEKIHETLNLIAGELENAKSEINESKKEFEGLKEDMVREEPARKEPEKEIQIEAKQPLNEPQKGYKDLEIYSRMIGKGVFEELAFKISEAVGNQLDNLDASYEETKKLAKVAVKDILGMPYKISKNSADRKVFFFIGPTGVGKTTTIAKIAARLSLLEGRNVALVTSDTFRIAAVDQLKTYSNIMNVPVSVVYKPIELEEVLDKYKDKDFVFVDTAGKNHKDEGLKDYIQSYIDVESTAEIFLLISLTTSQLDIKSIVDSYSFLHDYKLIFTKLDESASPGNILNVKYSTGKSTSFITNGQSVPDDIITADPDEIVDMIFD